MGPPAPGVRQNISMTFAEPVGGPIEHPRATTILVLGFVGLFCCGAVGPVAWVMAARALAEIDESHGYYGGRSQVLLGYVLGIVSTAVAIIGAVFFSLFACTRG
jgi:hypothetical protein